MSELKEIMLKADRILNEKLKKTEISYDMAEARVYDIRTVGVEGDGKTYSNPVELKLSQDGRI